MQLCVKIAMGLSVSFCSRFNIRFSVFTTFVKFLKKTPVKAGLKVFSYFQPGDMLELWLKFIESQPIYTYKHDA